MKVVRQWVYHGILGSKPLSLLTLSKVWEIARALEMLHLQDHTILEAYNNLRHFDTQLEKGHIDFINHTYRDEMEVLDTPMKQTIIEKFLLGLDARERFNWISVGVLPRGYSRMSLLS